MHQFSRHSQRAVGKRRANKLLTGSEYKRGGKVHSDEAQDRKLIKQMIKAEGRKEK